MLEIEFHNREKEIHEVMRILNSRPDLITFVYGPINSGKSSLMDEVVKKLPDDYVVFFIDLRAHVVTSIDEFYDILFSYEIGLKRKITKFSDVISSLLSSTVKFYSGFPLPENLVSKVLKKDKPKNAFTYIFNILHELKSKGKIPVIILDELQVIGDLKINGLLIYELFNFFVTISKRFHLAHVFAITSDSLFIEKVFNEAMLHGRCRYLLVDDFDYNTTKEFLEKHGFNQDEINLIWNYFGGKPVYLVEAIKNKDRLKDFCEKLVRLRRRQIKDSLYSLNVDFRKSVLKLLSNFKDRDFLTYDYLTEELRWCIKNNILFLDPLNDIVKPQSQLDLLAIREVLKRITS